MKGGFLAVLSTIYNFFILIGSKNQDSVIIGSLLSMYFIFIPLILILMRKRVSFRSAIGAGVAIVALLLMFDADTSSLFSSSSTIYLIIADVFFAFFVVSISTLGENEHAGLLSIVQMSCSAVIALCGWGVDCVIGKASFTLPTSASFWISAIFIGVLIRALYSVI